MESDYPLEYEKQTRQNRSVVHEMFDFVEIEGRKIAYCRLCTAKYKHNPQATSNLLTHCRTRHPKYTQDLGIRSFHHQLQQDLSTSYDPASNQSFNENSNSSPANVKFEEVDVPQDPIEENIPNPNPWPLEIKRKRALPERSEVFKNVDKYLMGRCWQQEVEKMTPEQQIFAKKAINDIIFEGQMGNLWRNAVEIRPRPSSTEPSEPNSRGPSTLTMGNPYQYHRS